MSKHSSALERLQRKVETLEQQRDDLLATLSIIVEEIRQANGLPHFSEEQMIFMVESIVKAKE